MQKMFYPGFSQDSHGITQLGRIVLDARVFGFIAETEECAGWDLGRMQALVERVNRDWDKYGSLPSMLPPELRERHIRCYDEAITRAKKQDRDAELCVYEYFGATD